MRLHGPTLLGGGLLLLVFCDAALADDEWQTVSLDNNPKFTIDIPAKAGSNYKPDKAKADQSALLQFGIETDEGGGLICFLNRYSNGAKANTKKLRDLLLSRRRDALCDDDTATNLTIIDSDSLTIDGLPAGECVASYTDINSPLHGRVRNPLEIVAANTHFLLTCSYVATSLDEATAPWASRWHEKVKHIQQSLHVPASEKK